MYCTPKQLWSLVCWEICIAYLCTSTATALDLDLLVMYLFQACSAFAFPPESFICSVPVLWWLVTYAQLVMILIGLS